MAGAGSGWGGSGRGPEATDPRAVVRQMGGPFEGRDFRLTGLYSLVEDCNGEAVVWKPSEEKVRGSERSARRRTAAPGLVEPLLRERRHWHQEHDHMPV